jgi:outer membrane autotransporter protein
MAATLCGGPALAQCATFGINQTCINGVLLSGGAIGILDTGTLTLTNLASGTITGTINGIEATTANITNAGTISTGNFGSAAIETTNSNITNIGIISGNIFGVLGGTNFINSGTITGGNFGIDAGVVNISNSGTISGGFEGVQSSGGSITNEKKGLITATGPIGEAITAFGSLNLTNYGTISGATGIRIVSDGNSSIFNAGTITGAGFFNPAIQFAGTGNVLTLGPGSVINGFVRGTGADTFQLGGTGTDTFDVSKIGAQYFGFSTFNKVDSSTWILTGTGFQTWNVLGGVLEGKATIGGLNVMSGAAVMPGNFGTLTVNGNVTFAAGSVYGVNVNAAGQSDKIAATGTATISGGTVQVLAQFGNFAPFTTYTILTAMNGVIGTFSNVVDNFAFLTPTLTYTPTSVLLTLTRNAVFVSQARTPNEASVAAALDHSPLTNPLVMKVLAQTAPGARQAFDALSGEIYGSLQSTLVEESFVLRQELLSRLRQAAYAGASVELGALAFGGSGAASDDSPALAYGPAPAFPVKAVPGSAAADRTWTLWGKALGGWGRADGDGNAAGVTSNFAGLITGADARFGDLLRLGLAGGYSHSSVGVDVRASGAGIDSAHVGAYAGAHLGPLDLRGGASYSFHNIDASRTVVFPGFFDQTQAHFHGATAQGFGEAGSGMAFGRLAVEPFAGLAFVHVGTNGFLESGGISALSGAAAREDVGYASAGVRAATALALPNGYWLIPRLAVAWQYAFSGVNPAAALAFQSTGAAFSTAGVPIARDSALAEGGIDLVLSPRAKLSLNYSGQLAASDQTHSVKGGFTWNF